MAQMASEVPGLAAPFHPLASRTLQDQRAIAVRRGCSSIPKTLQSNSGSGAARRLGAGSSRSVNLPLDSGPIPLTKAIAQPTERVTPALQETAAEFHIRLCHRNLEERRETDQRRPLRNRRWNQACCFTTLYSSKRRHVVSVAASW